MDLGRREASRKERERETALSLAGSPLDEGAFRRSTSKRPPGPPFLSLSSLLPRRCPRTWSPTALLCSALLRAALGAFSGGRFQRRFGLAHRRLRAVGDGAVAEDEEARARAVPAEVPDAAQGVVLSGPFRFAAPQELLGPTTEDALPSSVGRAGRGPLAARASLRFASGRVCLKRPVGTRSTRAENENLRRTLRVSRAGPSGGPKVDALELGPERRGDERRSRRGLGLAGQTPPIAETLRPPSK